MCCVRIDSVFAGKATSTHIGMESSLQIATAEREGGEGEWGERESEREGERERERGRGRDMPYSTH